MAAHNQPERHQGKRIIPEGSTGDRRNRFAMLTILRATIKTIRNLLVAVSERWGGIAFGASALLMGAGLATSLLLLPTEGIRTG